MRTLQNFVVLAWLWEMKNQPEYPVKILPNIKDICKLDFELSLNHMKKNSHLKITIARQSSQQGWGTVVINN